MEKDAKIYVAGHRGMVGSAIVRQLEKEGYTNIIISAVRMQWRSFLQKKNRIMCFLQPQK